MRINGVKVFSATMVRDRELLGDRVTDWLREHSTVEVEDVVITQSSDEAFHCVTITVLYTDPALERAQARARTKR